MTPADEWKPYKDGFVKDHIGVFPGDFGAWEAWENFSGEWQPCGRGLSAAREGSEHCPGEVPPYHFWERTREETITAAKRLAEDWLSKSERQP